MKKFSTLVILLSMAFFAFLNQTQAQIWEPEGVNLPGDWNVWVNPPTNALALASATQTPGGQVVRRVAGADAHWHTTIYSATAGDMVAGSYAWLFTSGPTSAPWSNKWNGVNVTMDAVQLYAFQHPDNSTITVADNKWYTLNLDDIGYSDANGIVMETSAPPVDFLTVSEPTNVLPNTAVLVTVTTNASLCPEEIVYICYTTDNWVSSNAVAATMVGTTGTATIPGQAANTAVKYYAFNSTMPGITSNIGLQAINIDNNAGANYSYSIGTPPPPTVGWCNLQWPGNGSIDVGQSYNVYGQIYITGVTDAGGQGADVQAWVGYSTTDSDPSTWTNWVPATYNADIGNNDEYMANIGTAGLLAGTYYYAYRYQYLNQAYVYGGFQSGFWDGSSNVSGVLTISSVIPLSNWSFLLFGFFAVALVLFKFRK